MIITSILVSGDTSSGTSGASGSRDRDVIEKVDPYNRRLRHGHGDPHEMVQQNTTGTAEHDVHEGTVFIWGDVTGCEGGVVEVLQRRRQGWVPEG